MQTQWEAMIITAGIPLAAMLIAGATVLLPGLALALDVRWGKPFLSTIVMVFLSGCALALWGWAVLPAAVFWVLVTAAVQWMLYRKGAFFDGLVVACAAAFVGLAGGLALLYVILKQDLVSALMSWVSGRITVMPADSPVDSALAFLAAAFSMVANGGMTLSGFKDAFEQMLTLTRPELMDQVLPILEESLRLQSPAWVTGLSIHGGLLAWTIPQLTLWNARRKKRRLPESVTDLPSPPPFALWAIPRWVSLPMMVMLVLAIIVRYTEWESMLAVSLAMESLVMTAFMVQGMAVIWFWLATRRIRPVGRVTVLALLYLLARSLLSWMGLFDMIFGIRRFWALRQQMMAELRGRNAGPPQSPAPDDQDKDKEDKNP